LKVYAIFEEVLEKSSNNEKAKAEVIRDS